MYVSPEAIELGICGRGKNHAKEIEIAAQDGGLFSVELRATEEFIGQN
jgi:hypothetical protein